MIVVTLLHEAFRQGKKDIVGLILEKEYGVISDFFVYGPLTDALLQGKVDMLRFLLEDLNILFRQSQYMHMFQYGCDT